MKLKKIRPKCSFKKVYNIRRGKLRFAACKYELIPHRIPLSLSPKDWKELIKWLFHGLSGQAISYEIGINRQQIYRALTIVRIVMSKDLHNIFSGTVKVDETYIGGQ